MSRTSLLPSFADRADGVALQLDNALAISSVAAGVPQGQRFLMLALGVLLAAACLFTFTLLGSNLIGRLIWRKPVAGLAVIVIGTSAGSYSPLSPSSLR